MHPLLCSAGAKVFTDLHRDAMSSFTGFGTASSSTATAPVAEKDIEVAEPPADSISCLAFAPQADYLAVSSWDNNVSHPRTVVVVLLNDLVSL